MPEFLQNADVFVLPSRKETFGNVVIEAMAAGLAVISTPVGVCPEVLDRNGSSLVEYGNTESLIHAMERYCMDPGISRVHGNHNNERIREFPTWRQVADMYIRLMLEILK